mgnify:CR=1 FL=1
MVMPDAAPLEFAVALDEIPLSLATAAHAGTSHTPERRGEQEREEYVAVLRADFAALARLADTDEKVALLLVEFARYRDGYRTVGGGTTAANRTNNAAGRRAAY